MTFRKKGSQQPLTIAALPGYVAGVQLLSDSFTDKPQLRKVEVQASTASTANRLDAMAAQLGVRRNPIRLLCEGADYQLLQAEIPAVPPEERKAAVGWQIRDQLRAPLDQVTLEVAAPAENQQGMRRPMGYVAVAENRLLRERMLQFRGSKAEVVTIGIPEFAQRNFADQIEEAGKATAILSITPNGGLLTVSREGALYFVRNFDVSTQSLADSEAARRDQFDRLVLEIQRSIDVLEHQFSFLSISGLWLAPFAYADELLSLLIDTLYLPVKSIQLAEVFDCQQCALPEDLNHQAALFYALGLALEAGHPQRANINLCNPALLPPKPFFQFKTMILSLLLFAAVVAVAAYGLSTGIRRLERQSSALQAQVQTKQEAVTQLERTLALRQSNPRIASEMAQAQDERRQLLQIADVLKISREGIQGREFSASLFDLARLPPRGVWLSQIEIRDERASLQGFAQRAEQIPEYLAALNHLPAFKGQQFSAFEVSRPGALTPGNSNADNSVNGMPALKMLPSFRDQSGAMVEAPRLEGISASSVAALLAFRLESQAEVKQ